VAFQPSKSECQDTAKYCRETAHSCQGILESMDDDREMNIPPDVNKIEKRLYDVYRKLMTLAGFLAGAYEALEVQAPEVRCVAGGEPVSRTPGLDAFMKARAKAEREAE
jgi:hypothetical protein